MGLSQTAYDSVAVALVTAAVSGFTIPLIFKWIDHRRGIDQKLLEAQLARQQKVIEAQSLFLDTLCSFLWQWRYLSIRLAYYGAEEMAEQHASARLDYDKDVWTLFHAVRTQISKARRLVSEDAYSRLLKFYVRMVELDKEIRQIRAAPAEEQPMKFSKLNYHIYNDLSEEIDTVMATLAHEVQLDSMSTILNRR